MELHQRTREFRQRYRDGISPSYSGWLHGTFVFGVGGAEMLYCFSQVQGLALWHYLLIPAALLFTNVGEYVAHRELGHKKRHWAKLFYSRHTGGEGSFGLGQSATAGISWHLPGYSGMARVSAISKGKTQTPRMVAWFGTNRVKCDTPAVAAPNLLTPLKATYSLVLKPIASSSIVWK